MLPDNDRPGEHPVTALFDRFAPAIFAYIHGYVHVKEDAEDLSIEVFVAALEAEHLPGLTEPEQLAWLKRVAHNKLVDRYRQQTRRPQVTLDALTGTIHEITSELLSPEEVVVRQEALQELSEAISKLSPLQQHLLQLRYGHGLRFADIAILLDRRETALRKLLSRTLATLHVMYSQHQGEQAYDRSR